MDLQKIYTTRFLHEELPQKNEIWKVICQTFFSQPSARHEIFQTMTGIMIVGGKNTWKTSFYQPT